MAVLELEIDNGVAIIRMNNGKNTQNLVFAQTLDRLLAEAGQDETVTALVVTSTDAKNWSQGIDLEWMNGAMAAGNMKDVRAFFQALDQVYHKLMLVPFPTIAAITGHAFGAGAFLATACDYRLMNAERGFFCFPEVDLKMDFLPGVFCMMQHKLPDFKLVDLVFSGKHATADELQRSFIVEETCLGVEATLAAALDFARGFSKDRQIFGIYKQKFNAETAKTMVDLNLAHFRDVH
ncbi:MAG: enoyl-CoA hydratase/isomerase family protein [bacterium]